MAYSTREARVYSATIALVKARYEEALAAVIFADPNLPAWKEAWAEADAMVTALRIDDLFEDLEGARNAEHEARRLQAEAENTNKILRSNLKDYEDNLDKKVQRAVDWELLQADREHELQMANLERDLETVKDELNNIKTGLALQDEIRTHGAVRTIDYLILEDTYCTRDYNEETYMLEGQFTSWL